MSKYITLGVVTCAVVLTGFSTSTQTTLAMEKAELIEAMASHSGVSKADSKKALDEFFAEATRALKKGDRLSLVGFGSFIVSKRANAEAGADATVEFFPDVRSTGTKNRHHGETVTADTIAARLAEKCRSDRKEESCVPYQTLIRTAITVTADTLAKGETIEWVHGESERVLFGTFSTAVAPSISKRSARTGRNPQTGKEIQIAAKNTVKFKAGAELSKAVN